MRKKTPFLLDILNPHSTASSKRFLTLIIAAHFVLASFLILIIFTILVFNTTKGSIAFLTPIIDVFKIILEYDFFIILAGLGFVTADNFGAMLIEKAKAKAAGQVLSPAPVVNQVQTVHGDVKGSTSTKTTPETDKLKKNLTKSLEGADDPQDI